MTGQSKSEPGNDSSQKILFDLQPEKPVQEERIKRKDKSPSEEAPQIRRELQREMDLSTSLDRLSSVREGGNASEYFLLASELIDEGFCDRDFLDEELYTLGKMEHARTKRGLPPTNLSKSHEEEEAQKIYLNSNHFAYFKFLIDFHGFVFDRDFYEKGACLWVNSLLDDKNSAIASQNYDLFKEVCKKFYRGLVSRRVHLDSSLTILNEEEFVKAKERIFSLLGFLSTKQGFVPEAHYLLQNIELLKGDNLPSEEKYNKMRELLTNLDGGKISIYRSEEASPLDILSIFKRKVTESQKRMNQLEEWLLTNSPPPERDYISLFYGANPFSTNPNDIDSTSF